MEFKIGGFYRAILFQVFVLFLANISAELINEVEYQLLPQLVKIDRYEPCKLSKPHHKYCVFDLTIRPISNTSNYVWDLIQTLNKDPRNFRHDYLTRGLCLNTKNRTAQKEHEYYMEVLNREFNGTGFEVENITGVVCDHFDREKDQYDIFGAVFIIFLIAFTFLCSYIDITVFKKLPDTKLSLGLRCLRCFSLTKNWSRLQLVRNSKENLHFIQGMRFLSISLIIFGHLVLFLMSSPIDNTYFMEKEDHVFTSGFLLNGLVVVQTYFWMSGMFLAYTFFKIMAKHKFHIKYIVTAIFLRYIRLIPSFAIVTLICTTILYHMGEGPFWEKIIGFDTDNCRKNWWANLLFISNELDTSEVCLVNGWYMSADFQLSLVSLCLITLIWFKRKWVYKILGTAFVISVFIPGIITYIFELDPLPLSFLERVKQVFANDKTYHMTYSQPHTNASTYFLGLISGYLLYTGDITKVPSRNKWFFIAVHFIGWISAYIVLFGAYIFYTEYYTPNPFIAAIFASVYKLIFTMVPLIVTWLIKSGNGVLYRQVLEWKPFVILGKLSFAIYLVHWPLLRAMIGMDMVPVYHGFYSIIAVRFVSVLVISILLAVFLALFVEFPVTSLMKIIVESFKNFKEDTRQSHSGSNTKNVMFVSSNDKILYS